MKYKIISFIKILGVIFGYNLQYENCFFSKFNFKIKFRIINFFLPD